MSQIKIRPWIVSFRLRTLPLSISCILIGSFLAAYNGKFSAVVFVLAAATTLLLQILSNLANEYGDMVKGTDSSERIGPERSLQSGELTIPQMKRMIFIIACITAVSGLSLVLYATTVYYTIIFLIAGASALVAAVKYTVGRKPYGYRAMGDLAVFIFFGPVGVIGTFFLHTGFFRGDIILPSLTAGLLSVAVLNLNNMRDIENDRKHGKITVALLLGDRYKRIYHISLLIAAVSSSIVFSMMNSLPLWRYIYLVAFIPLIISAYKVISYNNPSELDPELKKTAVSNMLHSILLGGVLLL